MGEGDWQAGYRKAVLAYVVSHAFPREPNEYNAVYGWQDYSGAAAAKRNHLLGCGASVEASSEVVDSQWSQFDGTFVDNSEHFGIDAQLTCNCGQVKELPVRLEKGLGEIIQGVVNQPPDPRDEALNEIARLGQEIGD